MNSLLVARGIVYSLLVATGIVYSLLVARGYRELTVGC